MVLTIRLVGIMLLIALLTLPILIAETWVRRFTSIMVSSVAISAATSLGGLMLSTLGDVPCSAIIVLLQVAVYAVARVGKDIAMRRSMQ